MKFADLNNLYKGETIYIIGTGPSLDNFDMDRVDGIQIAIHRAIGIVDMRRNDTFWQVLDDAWSMDVPGPWGEWLSRIKSDGFGLFRDPLMKPAKPWTPIPDHPNIIGFKSSKGSVDCLHYSRDRLAESGNLFTYCGSGCTAVHAAWYMGAEKIIMVGFDAGDGYAKRLRQWYDKPARGGFGYVMAHIWLKETIERLKIKDMVKIL